jgi:hypothetical protein
VIMTLLGRALGAIGSREMSTVQEPIRVTGDFGSAAKELCMNVATTRRTSALSIIGLSL